MPWRRQSAPHITHLFSGINRRSFMVIPGEKVCTGAVEASWFDHTPSEMESEVPPHTLVLPPITASLQQCDTAKKIHCDIRALSDSSPSFSLGPNTPDCSLSSSLSPEVKNRWRSGRMASLVGQNVTRWPTVELGCSQTEALIQTLDVLLLNADGPFSLLFFLMFSVWSTVEAVANSSAILGAFPHVIGRGTGEHQ